MSATYDERTAVQGARVIRAITGLYPEPTSRVDFMTTLDMLMAPSARLHYTTALDKWAKLKFNTKLSFQLWLVDADMRAPAVLEVLREFQRYVEWIVAVAKILRQSAFVIRTFGWVQGGVGDEHHGFDIIGALGYAFEGRASQLRLAVMDVLLSQLRVDCNDGAATGLQIWNDTPGRTVGDVLSLLEGCAAQMETP